MCCSYSVYRAIAAAALLLCACNTRARDTAASGAAPAQVALTRPGAEVAARPIGPTPGPIAETAEVGNPHGGDPVAAQRGRVLFGRYNCSGCHGDHGGGGMGPSLRDAVWIYGNSAGAVFSSIAQGRAHGMPAWG